MADPVKQPNPEAGHTPEPRNPNFGNTLGLWHEPAADGRGFARTYALIGDKNNPSAGGQLAVTSDGDPPRYYPADTSTFKKDGVINTTLGTIETNGSNLYGARFNPDNGGGEIKLIDNAAIPKAQPRQAQSRSLADAGIRSAPQPN